VLKIKSCKKIHYGELAEGCKECILGRKSVLFITGKCHYQCFYCPISDDKRMVDIVKINEKIIHDPDENTGFEEIVREIKLCNSWGVGITGGDPLLVVERTSRYIRSLKKEFGKKFHTHLYTSLQCVTSERLNEVVRAGLDEIRFHVPIEDKTFWSRLELAKDNILKRGVEIPAIPGTKSLLKELLDYIKSLGFISFVNINELEFSDVSDNQLTDKGFYVKDQLSYAIENSEDLARWAVDYGRSIDLPVHFCSASFKDDIQLRNRLLLRAENIRKPYDDLDDDGLLVRGEIRLNSVGLAEEFSLKEVFDTLKEYYEIPDEMIFLDDDRILIAGFILEEIFRDLQDHKEDFLFSDYIEASIIKEYPTDDHLLIEKHPL